MQATQAGALKKKELAKELAVSERTIDAGIAAGTINVVRFGRAVRIVMAEVERLKREGFSVKAEG